MTKNSNIALDDHGMRIILEIGYHGISKIFIHDATMLGGLVRETE